MNDSTRTIDIGVEFFERNNEDEFKLPQHINQRHAVKIELDTARIHESNLQWPTGFMYNYAYPLFNSKIWNNF